MIIPFSSTRSRRQDRLRQWPSATSRPIDYVATALAYQLPPDEDGGGAASGQMGFLDHLDELRRRIIRACIAVAVGMVVAFARIDHIVAFVLAPTRRVLPPGTRLIYTQPGEAFGLYVEVALIAGTLLAAPFIMFEVWRFIAPGLYAGEKRFAIPFVVLTSAGAVSGAAFSHFVLFPYMIGFFGTFQSTDLAFMPRLEDVFDLYTKMLFGMSVIFQMPTLAFFLARMQLVTARFLWRHLKYAVLIIFVVAAVLTPTADPWNQAVFAAPMIGLYFVSILIVWAVQPNANRSEPTGRIA
jgi:sec-independent protein translocase protein TatC